MKYEFKSANGRVCCSGDDFACLCKSCKERARVTEASTASSRQAVRLQVSSPGASGAVPRPSASGVPPPPDLTEAIRRKQATTRLTAAERRERARQIVADQPRPMANGSRP